MQLRRTSTVQCVVKTFLSLLAAAVVTAIIVTAVATTANNSNEGADVVFVFALAFTAAHVFILGLPLLLLGLWLHAIRWWSTILVAFVIGFVPSALVSGSSFLLAWPMGVLGAIGGLTFWLLWRFWVYPPSARATVLPPEEPAPTGLRPGT